MSRLGWCFDRVLDRSPARRDPRVRDLAREIERNLSLDAVFLNGALDALSRRVDEVEAQTTFGVTYVGKKCPTRDAVMVIVARSSSPGRSRAGATDVVA